MKTFSDRLKHARLMRGHTQKALARLARLSQSAIGSYESGLRHSSRSTRRLAQALKIDLEWLETGKGQMELPLDRYDLSDTLRPTPPGIAEPTPLTERKPRPHAPWPFPNISPSQFDALSAEDYRVLEALAQAFIEAVQARHKLKSSR